MSVGAAGTPQFSEEAQAIETAPKDGRLIVGLEFGRYAAAYRVWWQPEFSAWVKGCRLMTLADGLTFNEPRQPHESMVKTTDGGKHEVRETPEEIYNLIESAL